MLREVILVDVYINSRGMSLGYGCRASHTFLTSGGCSDEALRKSVSSSSHHNVLLKPMADL